MFRMLKNKKGEERIGLPNFKLCPDIGALVNKFRQRQGEDPKLKIKENKNGYTVRYGLLRRKVADLYSEPRTISYRGASMDNVNVVVYKDKPQYVEDFIGKCS